MTAPSSPAPLSVLVVDDHPIFRAGLLAMLLAEWPGLAASQASTLAEGLRLAGTPPLPDLALVDLRLPDAAGTEAITAFGRAHPSLPLLVVSAFEQADTARAALAAGALGYVAKTDTATGLHAAVAAVLRGEIHAPLLRLDGSGGGSKAGGDGAAAEGVYALTTRQTEVLRLIALGRSNREIGTALGASEKTVKAHVTAILRQLGAANRTDAARMARDLGLA